MAEASRPPRSGRGHGPFAPEQRAAIILMMAATDFFSRLYTTIEESADTPWG
ncbi:hypothetical protein [Streptomyces sp. NPDC050388]|uniref:hypothetical protein n=1 Tax=Streptomyces sp. NPDC050388 TaxID=3155781 RepID=UPI00342FDCFD